MNKDEEVTIGSLRAKGLNTTRNRGRMRLLKNRGESIDWNEDLKVWVWDKANSKVQQASSTKKKTLKQRRQAARTEALSIRTKKATADAVERKALDARVRKENRDLQVIAARAREAEWKKNRAEHDKANEAAAKVRLKKAEINRANAEQHQLIRARAQLKKAQDNYDKIVKHVA